jgi:putative DNA primase/helicase
MVVPSYIRDRKQWVAWRVEVRNGDPTKVPVNVKTGGRAASDKPATWTDLQSALAYKGGEGAGLMFADDDGLFGGDLDGCINADGVVHEAAVYVLERFATYWEVSPSGTGIKLLGRGNLDAIREDFPDKTGRKTGKVPWADWNADKKGALEIYDRRRFFTLTGRTGFLIKRDGKTYIEESPEGLQEIIEAQAAVDALLGHYFANGNGAGPRRPAEYSALIAQAEGGLPLAASDDAVIALASERGNGKWQRLFVDGDTSAYGDDDSRADFALLELIAHYRGPHPDNIAAIFRRSALYRPEKERTSRGYIERSIANLLQVKSTYFQGSFQEDEDDPFDIGSPNPDPKYPKLNDHGMARLVVECYGDRLRNVNESREWIACRDGRWYGGRPAEKMAEQAAMRSLLLLPKIVSEIGEEDTGYREKALKYAASNTTRTRRDAVLAVARAEPDLMIAHDMLDRRPMLLACANGTLDLATGVLRPHDPRDYLTRGTPVAYDPDATCPRFERFLVEIFGGDKNLISYMQRVFGYCLTGEVKEELFWILLGTGGNGKSKLMKALEIALGHDLLVAMDFASFLGSRSSGGHTSSDIARLDGRRVAIAQEKRAGKPLDDSVVKRLTGGDRIVARALYSDEVEFDPTFKVFLVANEAPKINSTEVAMRRRARVVPFERRFLDDDADLDLAKVFEAEAPGILAWCVRGCLEWQQIGIGTSAAVEKATEDYLREMNPLSLWIEERCAVDSDAKGVTGLWQSYGEWCEATGTDRLGSRDWSNAMETLGFTSKRTAHGIEWSGVRLQGWEDIL